MVWFFNLSLVAHYWSQSEVIFYFRPLDCVLKLFVSGKLMFLAYLIVQMTTLIIFQNWLWVVHATGRRQTINETKNCHLYRYIFKRVVDHQGAQKSYLYIHRYYNIFEMARNIYLF